MDPSVEVVVRCLLTQPLSAWSVDGIRCWTRANYGCHVDDLLKFLNQNSAGADSVLVPCWKIRLGKEADLLHKLQISSLPELTAPSITRHPEQNVTLSIERDREIGHHEAEGYVGGETFALCTKALITFQNRVSTNTLAVVDPGSLFNLIPNSLVRHLKIPTYSNNAATLNVGSQRILAEQFCHFDVRIGTFETTIRAAVVPNTKRSAIQLGRLWVKMANLLCDFDSQTYYMPGTDGKLIKLPADIAEEPGVSSVEIRTHPDDEPGDHSGDDEVRDDRLYPVERILDERKHKGRQEYQILWESTWEPRENIRDRSILNAWRFEKKRRGRTTPERHKRYNLRQKLPSRKSSPISAGSAKRILSFLAKVRKTRAGSNFRAPVTQLWPECAESYRAKICHPVDLESIGNRLKACDISIEDLKSDVSLIYQNTKDFNGVDDNLTTAALEVRDSILDFINADQDEEGGRHLRDLDQLSLSNDVLA